MRIRHHASLGLAATACLVLSGCTNAADWNANRSSQIHSFDTSSIQAQPRHHCQAPSGRPRGRRPRRGRLHGLRAGRVPRPFGHGRGLRRRPDQRDRAVLGVKGKVHTAEFD